MPEKKGNNKDTNPEAPLKLVELTYATSEEHMAELTFIGRRQSINFSLMVMNETSVEFLADVMRGNVKGGKKPKLVLLSEVFRNWYYKHQRSVDGRHIKAATDLAQAQIEAMSADDVIKDSEDW